MCLPNDERSNSRFFRDDLVIIVKNEKINSVEEEAKDAMRSTDDN